MVNLIQPKPYLEKIKLRNKATGVERRRNMSKIVLEKGTPFPKPIEYSDIDTSFYDWVDKKLEIAYDGKLLPTYKLFSNQRISEYSQTWKNLDEAGNIVMNFKTITRENNPQHGTSQGSMYNIPGHRDYTMFYVPVLQENGEEAYDLYTMKQPFSVDFSYTVNIIANKYEILNEFNRLINYEFQGLECYIAPNGYYMPMVLEGTSDESEYDMNDRKYYAQTYNIKVYAYIIRKEDFQVKRMPSRMIMRMLVDEKITNKRKKFNLNSLKDKERKLDYNITKHIIRDFDKDDECTVNPSNKRYDIEGYNVEIEEKDLVPECCYKEEDKYFNKELRLVMNLGDCDNEISFTIDTDLVLQTVETENVYDFVLRINDEVMDIENQNIIFYNEDKIRVNISRDDDYKDSKLTFVGYDPNVVLSKDDDPESSLDEPVTSEEITVSNVKENEEIQDK